MIDKAKPVAIVGGLGKTGRRVATLLAAAGRTVRPLSRSTEPPFDWNGPETWQAALTDAGAVYATFQPDLSVPGAAETIARFAAVAREIGVDHIVMLSGRGEPGALLAEQALSAFGGRWTVVRASWFAQNFSESFMAGAVLAGELVIPTGTAAEPFVDADDIAEVAVAALCGAIPSNRVYEVTGPEAIRFPEACAILEEAIGRPLICLEVEPDAFVAHLSETGVPEPLVPVLSDLFLVTLNGRNVTTAQGVAEALGRPPRSFGDYARRAVERGTWQHDPA